MMMNIPDNRVAMDQLGRTIPRKCATVQHILADGKVMGLEWSYYDTISCDQEADRFPTLICIPDAANTALSFFRQLTTLSAHGIRVVAVTPAGYPTMSMLISGLDIFVTTVLRKTGVHFLGVGLGAYIIQCYAVTYSSRMLSAILCNGFFTTSNMQGSLFQRTATVMPEFMLKRHFLTKLNADATDPLLVDLVELSANMIESMNGAQLGGQLNMLLPCVGVSTAIEPEKVTIIRSDNVQLYNKATEDEYEKVYADAKTAIIKDGGNMPQIAAAGEFNMHIQVHIRNQEQRVKDEAAAAAAAAATKKKATDDKCLA